MRDGIQQFVEVAAVSSGWLRGMPSDVQQRVEVVFGGERRAVVGAEAVGEEGERALGDDFRIELFEGAGGGVAGIGEGRQAGFVAFGVHRGEGGVGHEDLAADFQRARGSRIVGSWI